MEASSAQPSSAVEGSLDCACETAISAIMPADAARDCLAFAMRQKPGRHSLDCACAEEAIYYMPERSREWLCRVGYLVCSAGCIICTGNFAQYGCLLHSRIIENGLLMSGLSYMTCTV